MAIKTIDNDQIFWLQTTANTLTAVLDEHLDSKVDIIEYTNLEYRSELVSVLNALSNLKINNYILPIIDEIYKDGVVIDYLPNDDSNCDEQEELTASYQLKSIKTIKPFIFL